MAMDSRGLVQSTRIVAMAASWSVVRAFRVAAKVCSSFERGDELDGSTRRSLLRCRARGVRIVTTCRSIYSADHLR